MAFGTPGSHPPRPFCSCSHILDLWTLIGARRGSVRGIQHHEFTHNPVGPAKAILCRILSAATLAVGSDHVVFLDQLATAAIDAHDRQHPTAGDALRQARLLVAPE